MKRLEYRPLKRHYQRAKLYSFLLTVATVDSVMGFVSIKPPLLLFGLGTIGIVITLQWLQAQNARSRTGISSEHPVHYLPDQTSHPKISRPKTSRL